MIGHCLLSAMGHDINAKSCSQMPRLRWYVWVGERTGSWRTYCAIARQPFCLRFEAAFIFSAFSLFVSPCHSQHGRMSLAPRSDCGSYVAGRKSSSDSSFGGEYSHLRRSFPIWLHCQDRHATARLHRIFVPFPLHLHLHPLPHHPVASNGRCPNLHQR